MYVSSSLSASSNTVVRSTSYSSPRKISPVATASSFALGALLGTGTTGISISGNTLLVCSVVLEFLVAQPLSGIFLWLSPPSLNDVKPITANPK